MKKMILIINVIYFTVFSPRFFSQYGIRTEDKTSIEQQLNTIYGFDYKVADIINVDSVENIYNTKFGLINNPYGTLKNCLLFTANKKDASSSSNNYSMVGVYKNNQIIWRSNFVIPEYFRYGKIFGTIDLNNNGKVDILTQWADEQYKETDLWIYEWDGARATIINNYNEYGPLIGTSEYTLFEFADFEGDGIWEIVGYEPTSLEPASNIPNDYEIYVYAWDGIKYKYSRTIKKNSLEMFFPRTKFTAQIKAEIQKKEQSFFRYSYNVKNDPSSAQYINHFDVYVKTDTISNKIKSIINTPNGWGKYIYFSTISWVIDIDNFFSKFTTKYKIKPGTELDNFSFEAQGLPALVVGYLRGFNYDLAQSDENYTRIDDYIHNSVIDSTVGPSNPPSPFIPLNFLDTLISYKHSSVSLGWIDNQGIASSLDSTLENAKKKLSAGDITAARNILNAFVNEVEAQNGKHLTSEAYALLKFNTEYLINRLK